MLLPTPPGWRGAPGIPPHRTWGAQGTERGKACGHCSKERQNHSSPGCTLSSRHTCCSSCEQSRPRMWGKGGPRSCRCPPTYSYLYPSRGSCWGPGETPYAPGVCSSGAGYEFLSFPAACLCQVTEACAHRADPGTPGNKQPCQAPGEKDGSQGKGVGYPAPTP